MKDDILLLNTMVRKYKGNYVALDVTADWFDQWITIKMC